MVRVLIAAAVAASLSFACGAAAAQEPSRTRFEFGADLGFVHVDGYPSFLDYSAGKLRYSPDDDGLVIGRAWFDYQYRLADTVSAHMSAANYADDIGPVVGAIEAYLEWKPLTLTPTRYRVKAGAFYPRISLENVDSAWATPYTITPSAINTWLGEEFRTFGVEVAATRRPQSLGGAHTFSVFGAVYTMNDPAGTLLAWKGWSLHDRQTRLGDEIPLPPVPQIQPGMAFDSQAPYENPFVETDHRLGWYLGGEWVVDRRLIVRGVRYDNRADPTSYKDGQFGWDTKFTSLGVQATLPGDIGLIAQWMDGSTVWGWEYNDVRLVTADFDSSFLLVTRSFDRHRLSLRYDRFRLTDRDGYPEDDNGEVGHAWTAAYQFAWKDYLTVAGEWLEVSSSRPAWDYFGFATSASETQLQLMLRLHFGT